MSLRITGGLARGIRLKVPSGEGTRPATDQMREALFASLGEVVCGARCLDCFAGSGSYGLEALSRGAREVHFVEQERRALACLRENLAAVEKALAAAETAPRASTTIHPRDVLRLGNFSQPFDLVFCDSPYAEAPKLLARLFHCCEDWLTDGLLALEVPSELEIEPAGWTLQRQFGKRKGHHSPKLLLLKRIA
ncbi:MAG: 16S rRNA (guanine(966)-N(2))-methyltransferase RsmD [Verrucomicrobiota bacterium]